jgi:hypothetical protein
METSCPKFLVLLPLPETEYFYQQFRRSFYKTSKYF